MIFRTEPSGSERVRKGINKSCDQQREAERGRQRERERVMVRKAARRETASQSDSQLRRKCPSGCHGNRPAVPGRADENRQWSIVSPETSTVSLISQSSSLLK